MGLILAGTSLFLASETKSLLIGENANREVNEVLTMHMVPDFILVNNSSRKTEKGCI